MRAAQFIGNGQIKIIDAPDPTLAPDEVLLKVAYCGLCGSDRKPYKSGFPLIPGHEVSGTVVRANGSDVDEGSRVVAYLNVYCGDCRYCQQGLTNLCLNSRGLLGWSAPWNGGYAEYMAVPARDILPVHDSVGLDSAVLLLDTIGTAWHAIRLAQAETASRVLVVGCGPLGLGAVAGLVAFGVPEIFACDLAEPRRTAAKDLGAMPVKPEEVGSLTDLDVIIEAAGHPTTLMQAIRQVSPGGKVVMLGEIWEPWMFEPSAATMLKDYSLIRSWYFPIGEYAENQQMLIDGKIDPTKLISHSFPLEELDDAFRHFFSGNTRKVLSAS
jgi:2-desacetyl-2-hydroxyethyl bacteriochlorophyllide A dehydrogenase